TWASGHNLQRFTAFHDMDFYCCGKRARGRNVDRSQQEIGEVKCKEPHDSARELFSPPYNLMPVGKISLHLPNTFAMFCSECFSSRIPDYLEYRVLDDLKSVAYRR